MPQEVQVEQFMKNILNSPDLIREMAKSPTNTQAVYEKINSMAAGGRIPGGLYFRIQSAVGNSLVITKEAASNFSDNDMLLLYKDYFGSWFTSQDFRERNALNNPVFEGVQSAFSSAVGNGHNQCLAYLLQNVDISEYDVDGIAIIQAIDGGHAIALALIAEYADPNTFGTKGSLGGLIHPRIKQSVNNCSWLSPATKNKLLGFNILR